MLLCYYAGDATAGSALVMELRDESDSGPIPQEVTHISSEATPDFQANPDSISKTSTPAHQEDLDVDMSGPSQPPPVQQEGAFAVESPSQDQSVHCPAASDNDFYESLSVETAEAKNVYVPKWLPTNDF